MGVISNMISVQKRFVLAAALAGWAAAVAAQATPSILVDTNEAVVLCPQGSTVTQVVQISNCGDATLTWSLADAFAGTNFVKIARQFKIGSGTAYSMKYDATRDCLWAHSYTGADVARLSVTNGSLLGTKNMGTNALYSYGIEVEGGNLWGMDYYGKRFVKFDLNTMAVLQRTPAYPSG